MKKLILSIMPDYGNGPYLWLLKGSSLDCMQVGGSIASYKCWPDDEFLSSVTNELKEDFDDWILQFELYSEFRLFKWDTFHNRGQLLAYRLKNQLGDKAIVRYVKPHEDPNHEQNEITIIE